ncbi:hypothetical protein EOD42_13960 [Rhodovarius crocodyli]|uniref:Uncharacterized protein n=1 Tax=Rhodovarius crocodyli TaxID=1979269 RepID=A0A437MF23_9PROT|nr:hypothetical protein [Rhodovarius crocodyli]RVT96216.1 hypothetical protein EOD42_13960 [Rhodovarius crocodyli]
MTRYGRNQKRAHRAVVKRLQAELAATKEELALFQQRLRAALYQSAGAEERAFEKFAAQSGMLAHVTETMAREVGRFLGPHEAAAARQLVGRDRNVGLYLRHDPMASRPWRVVTIDVPSARMEVAVDE